METSFTGAITFLVSHNGTELVVAIGVALIGVPLLRYVNLTADDRMDTLGVGVIVKLHLAPNKLP